jgi:hypothetical protein
VDERCASLAQRDDARTIFDWEKIEPAPDTAVTALAHGRKIAASQMTDLDLDFENGSTLPALELGPRRCPVRALRTMQIVNDSHLGFLFKYQRYRHPSHASNLLVEYMSYRLSALRFSSVDPSGAQCH